ncbi:MAG: RecX family transcriptional regulator [Candidatus Doudnabacteria bacterium]|nr:RecX family transcriptional regulator [Candidatus Doudnabacteria bacterium]
MVNTYEKALSLIKIRPHHSEELKRKLLMRGFGHGEVSETILRLTEQGLLNDAQFGQMYLESLLRYKTYGFYGLKAKLLQKGLASNEAEKLLRENLSLDLELELAAKLLRKGRLLTRDQAASKLARKGFRSEVVSRAIGNLSNNMV